MDKKVILIVEDENSLLKALAIKLRNSGYTILLAADGENGLHIALKDQPELIILDIALPKMDGLTMFAKLREDPWGKEAKVMILTNFNGEGDLLDKIIIYKPAFYLMKSDTSLEKVLEKVRELLDSPKNS